MENKLRIYRVTWNDGGWHSGDLPNQFVVAETSEKAKELANLGNNSYKNWSCWSTEFKMDGYVIEVFEKSQYERDKKIVDLVGNVENK